MNDTIRSPMDNDLLIKISIDLSSPTNDLLTEDDYSAMFVPPTHVIVRNDALNRLIVCGSGAKNSSF